MYHINHEGKVYPCRAKVHPCPYGNDMHARNKEELYYKVMQINRDVEPSVDAKIEINTLGRLKSLYPLSDEIAKKPYPIELILSTLEYAIEVQKNNSPQDVEDYWDKFVNNSAEKAYESMRYGVPLPDYVPEEIQGKASQFFHERLDSTVIDYSIGSRNSTGLSTIKPIRELEPMFEKFEDYKKWGLTEENYDDNMYWLKYDFYKFSHDFNTSKVISRPLFPVEYDELKDVVKKLSDDELLSAYDDYQMTEQEVEDNVKLANYFNYKNRSDLTERANAKLSNWYNINRQIWRNWDKSKPKRILLSLELAKELDKRNISRQESIVK